MTTTNKKNVDEIINKFSFLLSQQYDLSIDEIKDVWYSSNSSKEELEKVNESSSSSVVPELLRESADKYSKTELVELCKTKNLKYSGTKDELYGRLISSSGGNNNNENIIKSTIDTKKKNNNKKKSILPKNEPKIFQFVKTKVPEIKISKNAFGHKEHKETGFIFDENDKVYGKQNVDGTICFLDENDIDICKQYKFGYIIPTNLEHSSKNNQEEIVEELDASENLEILEDDDDDDEVIEEEQELQDE